MTSNMRRSGFRLPWSPDDADEQVEGASVDEAQAASAAASDDALADDAPAADAPADAAPAGAQDPAPEAEPASDSSGFLASLVSAMRSAAEDARDTNLAEFRASIEARVAELEAGAAERAEDLRRRADLDISGIEDWERAEVDRVKTEAEHRLESRRQQLEQQLADHRSGSEQEVAAARRRLEEHERQLSAFFSQLSEITDPAAFVAAAKRIPRPPEVGQTHRAAEAAAPQSGETLTGRLTALGVDRSAEPTETAGAGETTDLAEAAPAPDEQPASQAESRDASLASRLAQLDDRIAQASDEGAGEPAEPAETAETSTAIVVKGLGSFGAITSFKQALERVDGIHGVTLSLGPTGEFVYRASHTTDFDVVAAIRSVEGPSAEIEHSDGQIHVTVSRAR